LRDLLAFNKDKVSDMIFTSLQEVVQCDTMDQLQMIISKLTQTDSNSETKRRSAFFQIKFLDLNSDGTDEVMIIILDIS